LLNTRGLMELIALNIGYDLGILSPRIFTMLVIMALVTTMLTGPLMTLFRRQKYGGPIVDAQEPSRA
jgi:Kef-type K+ transport system membrane component KefB